VKTEEIDRRNGEQRRHQPRCHLSSLRACNVEPQREESYRDVQDFPRDLVLVDKGPPMSVDWDEPEGARAATEIPPAPETRRGRTRRGKVSVTFYCLAVRAGNAFPIVLNTSVCLLERREPVHRDRRSAPRAGPSAVLRKVVIFVRELVYRMRRAGLLRGRSRCGP